MKKFEVTPFQQSEKGKEEENNEIYLDAKVKVIDLVVESKKDASNEYIYLIRDVEEKEGKKEGIIARVQPDTKIETFLSNIKTTPEIPPTKVKIMKQEKEGEWETIYEYTGKEGENKTERKEELIGTGMRVVYEYDGRMKDLLTEERDKYDANDVRPGLTGLAQINGRDTIKIADKAEYDGNYVKNISLLEDIKIFLGTLHVFAGDDSIVDE